MEDRYSNIEYLNEKSYEFFSKGKIDWQKTEAEVWNDLSGQINVIPAGKEIKSITRIMKFAAAAVFLMLAGLSGLIFLYSKTIETVPGEHLSVKLPYGSAVELNAGSHIKYYPLKWYFSRKVYFEGEGFFSVRKGNNFEVISKNGITSVLGTTFNVFSRDNKYKVTCLSGLVKVTSNSERTVILKPNTHVEIKEGKFIYKEEYKTDRALAWRNNQFFFSGTPLKEVFEEIGRQYGVTIKIQSELRDRNFIGNFRKKDSVEEILDDICKPMQLSYEKSSKNVFLVREKS